MSRPALHARLARIPPLIDALRDRGVHPFGYETRELRLNPVAPPESIAAFEARHGVGLPEEYRDFLMRVGDGGAGPGFGVLPLDRAVQDYDRRLPADVLATPFRHEVFYDPDRDDALEALVARADRGEVPEWEVERVLDYETAGTVMLCDEGCGYHHRLVVTGPTRGSVWVDSRGGSGGFAPLGIGFLEWYERWLDDVAAGGRGA